MARFNVGDNVIRSDSGDRGIILRVEEAHRGRQLYQVKYTDGREAQEFEVNLSPDCDITDPFERCRNGLFDSYAEYSKRNTSFKIRSSNNSTISSLKASKTLFRAYQFKPLLKFLNSPNRRLLIADEVGLGKTIEAGHILLELKARQELRHVLIVCPKSLQNKWKDELAFKFGLVFKIYENQKDLIQDMEDGRISVHAILNYEKIRLKDIGKGEKKRAAPNVIDYLSENVFQFSMVLCDEAHKLRNDDTQTYKGAEIIMSHTEAAAFLTATPVMISTENLYNLLHLLDNTRYYNYQIFDNRLQENRPFVEALTNLNHQVALPQIAKRLEESEVSTSFSSDGEVYYTYQTTVGELFANDALYQEIIRMLNGEDNTESRARLQYLLSSMSMMNNIFSRTRKREVITDMSQAERKPHMRRVILTSKEREEFDNVIETYKDDNSYTNDWGEEVLTLGGALGLVQKKRQVASSVYAYLNDEDDLDKGIDRYADYPDAKFDELLKIIDEVFKHGTKKIVVFALFRKTLKYLQIRFKEKGYGTLIIHGGVENRVDVLDEFKNNPKAHILLSSEVGSEGLDMQFCNSMVNYDLPWNPMVVEQRIGRIDRFGQQSPTVNIYNIIVANSIQEDIYIRLLERIGIFRGSIGDMEAILDAPLEKGGRKVTIQDVYNDLERELFTCRLTEAERQRKISEIEVAIAKEKEDIKQLEEGLDGALTNDAYFKEEINRILNNNAYVTETELRNYLESVIRQELTTCSLVPVEEGIYEFQLPASDPRVLHRFLNNNQPRGEEAGMMFRLFSREIENKRSFRITFNQQIAYENNKLIFINIYHPIIQACLHYFSRDDGDGKATFCYAITEDHLLRAGSSYYMIIYQMSTTRMVLKTPKHTEVLVPLLYSVEKRAVLDDETLVNHVFSRSQTEGLERNLSNQDIDQDMIQDMRYDFADAIEEVKKKRLSELKLQVESDRMRNEKQTTEYFDSLINNQQKYIHKWENELLYDIDVEDKRVGQMHGIINIAQARIRQMEKEKEERIAQIQEASIIKINESVKSLNLIKIV